MPEEVRAVAWDAFPHHYFERKNDWFWIMGIAIVTIATISVFFGNTLLGILILIGGTVMLILASRPPQIVAYTTNTRTSDRRNIAIGWLLIQQSHYRYVGVGNTNHSWRVIVKTPRETLGFFV